jgi:hypothetical protein
MASSSSETSVYIKPARRHSPDDGVLQVIFLCSKFSLTCAPCNEKKGRLSYALLSTEGSARHGILMCDPDAILRFPSARPCYTRGVLQSAPCKVGQQLTRTLAIFGHLHGALTSS